MIFTGLRALNDHHPTVGTVTALLINAYDSKTALPGADISHIPNVILRFGTSPPSLKVIKLKDIAMFY